MQIRLTKRHHHWFVSPLLCTEKKEKWSDVMKERSVIGKINDNLTQFGIFHCAKNFDYFCFLTVLLLQMIPLYLRRTLNRYFLEMHQHGSFLFSFHVPESWINSVWRKLRNIDPHVRNSYSLSLSTYRVIFNRVSKGNCVCFGFALLLSVIGQKSSRYFSNQWEVKPKPTKTCKCAFSRPLRRLHVIASHFDWLIALFRSVVIGWSNCFGFGFTTII